MVDEVVDRAAGATGRDGPAGAAGGREVFLEGRPLFLLSDGKGAVLSVEVVFFSFGGLPLFFGRASWIGESVRTGFSLVMDILSLESPN